MLRPSSLRRAQRRRNLTWQSRLLRFARNDNEKAPDAQLSPIDNRQAPTYHALSYTNVGGAPWQAPKN